MPALIDAAALRERFDIDDADAYPDARILPHIGSASRRLRQWVGADLYAKAGLVDTDPNYDADLTSDLKNAEAHLAMHYAIVGFNSPLSHKGVVATSQSDEGREMRKYLTPDETAKLSQQFLDLANEMVGAYLTAVDLTPVEVVYTSGCDTSCEAVTRPC